MSEKKPDKEPSDKSGGGSIKMIVFLLVGAIILIGGAVAATLYFTGTLNKILHGDAAGGHHGAPAAEAHPPPPPLGPPSYLDIKPPFVVNVVDPRQVRFMQVGVCVMARNAASLNGVTDHMIAIKNDLREIFSGQPLEAVVTREGIERLRVEALKAINGRLKTQHIAPIDAVYFTTFIAQ